MGVAGLQGEPEPPPFIAQGPAEGGVRFDKAAGGIVLFPQDGVQGTGKIRDQVVVARGLGKEPAGPGREVPGKGGGGREEEG
ncbi:MAG: hypothetical protein LBP23_07995 [Treponema sp.]|nr:hypothetical protein [Treponema sp.]